MRLLLTRATADAEGTWEKLAALGHQVVHAPVFEIVGTRAAWPAGVVDALLATSAHAFTVPLEGPAPEVRRLLPLFLVGARTAAQARAHDFLGPAIVAKNAAALAVEIGRLLPDTKRIVYLAGHDRKPDIEAALESLHRHIDVVEVYAARACGAPGEEAARAFRHGRVEAVLHYSRRSAALLIEMAASHGLDLAAPAHFCLSEDVAAPLRDAGLADIHVAAEPREEVLLALLPAADAPAA